MAQKQQLVTKKRIIHFFIKKTQTFSMKILYSILIIIFSQINVFCQDENNVDSIATKTRKSDSLLVEMLPQYPDGTEAMYRFIAKNIKYPEKAKNALIEGKVYASFVIEKDGTVGEMKILKGIGYGCDEETLRVIALMPNWTPGMQNNKAVRVQMNLPVSFKLEKKKKKGKKIS